mgnify:CR=1 FL=1
MAEKLAFEQFMGDGGTVYAHQNAVAPVAGLMDGARDQFLAGPRFPGDQDVGIGRGDQIDLFKRTIDRLGLADDFVMVVGREDFFLKIGVFKFQPFAKAINLGQGGMQLFLGNFA